MEFNPLTYYHEHTSGIELLINIFLYKLHMIRFLHAMLL